jgi:hypothetical protein
MSNALGAIPSESRAVIVDELTRRNPELLAGLRRTQELTSRGRSPAAPTSRLVSVTSDRNLSIPCARRLAAGPSGFIQGSGVVD